MQTFRQLARHFGATPAALVNVLAGLDLARGRQELSRNQHPQGLDTLVEIARIQSTEASNEIEGVTASPQRIKALMAEKTAPANRPEEEIAGYRDVLNTIHASAADIPVKVSVVEQLHRDLYKYTSIPSGHFKTVDNTVTETRADGVEVVRFEPVSAFETPAAMDELHERFEQARADGSYHPLLLVGAYVLDFLVIHPFRDGNGRMARLLTLLLLYQANYVVGRYISLERLINDSRETYYEALQRSTVGWHDGEHDIQPWLQYLLGILTAACKEFEERVGALSGPGSKSAAIETFIDSLASSRFSFDDIRRAVPTASDSLIQKRLAALRRTGQIRPLGTGRGAEWERVV